MKRLDPTNPIHREIMDLEKKGIVETGWNADTGELIVCITEKGLQIAEQIEKEEKEK